MAVLTLFFVFFTNSYTETVCLWLKSRNALLHAPSPKCELLTCSEPFLYAKKIKQTNFCSFYLNVSSFSLTNLPFPQNLHETPWLKLRGPVMSAQIRSKDTTGSMTNSYQIPHYFGNIKRHSHFHIFILEGAIVCNLQTTIHKYFSPNKASLIVGKHLFF